MSVSSPFPPPDTGNYHGGQLVKQEKVYAEHLTVAAVLCGLGHYLDAMWKHREYNQDIRNRDSADAWVRDRVRALDAA